MCMRGKWWLVFDIVICYHNTQQCVEERGQRVMVINVHLKKFHWFKSL